MEKNRLARASTLAEQILEGLNLLSIPVKPEAVVACEPDIVLIGEDFGTQFDGQLEFHRAEEQFLMFYNTRYDQGRQPGDLHPRTRFSISHELGHFHIPEHRQWLMKSGVSHKSHSEFTNDNIVEREADAFASSLLLPARLVAPLLNQDELTLDVISSVAEQFETSRVSTAIRATQLSEFPTGVVGIREGKIAWWSYSDSLIESGCYPIGRQVPLSLSAQAAWVDFANAKYKMACGLASVQDWFQTFDQDRLDNLSVSEQYLAIPTMETLVVLLAIPEEELYGDNDDNTDGDDNDL